MVSYFVSFPSPICYCYRDNRVNHQRTIRTACIHPPIQTPNSMDIPSPLPFYTQEAREVLYRGFGRSFPVSFLDNLIAAKSPIHGPFAASIFCRRASFPCINSSNQSAVIIKIALLLNPPPLSPGTNSPRSSNPSRINVLRFCSLLI